MLSRLSALQYLLAAVFVACPAAQACEGERDATAGVSQVYPTADVLPANLLRFYIYFSQPMLRYDIWSSVVLLDENGDVIPGAFIENKFDLWSPDDMRLTVLFDPGRVKTGLGAHKTLGRALAPGNEYRLIVRESARTRAGCSLSGTFEKTFTATNEDFDAPNLENWQIHRPRAETKDPLQITLDGPADHISLAYRIRVTDDAGQIVRGSLRLAGNEQEWIFTPNRRWGHQLYKINVNTILEDIAGNRLTGLFDRPLETGRYSTPGTPVQMLSFSPQSDL